MAIALWYSAYTSHAPFIIHLGEASPSPPIMRNTGPPGLYQVELMKYLQGNNAFICISILVKKKKVLLRLPNWLNLLNLVPNAATSSHSHKSYLFMFLTFRTFLCSTWEPWTPRVKKYCDIVWYTQDTAAGSICKISHYRYLCFQILPSSKLKWSNFCVNHWSGGSFFTSCWNGSPSFPWLWESILFRLEALHNAMQTLTIRRTSFEFIVVAMILSYLGIQK